jgi:Rod binding domain-containing protein
MDPQSAAAPQAPQGPPPAPIATPEQRAKIAASAKAFEAQLVSLMLQPMFEGISTDGPFGGGQAEGTYRSFMLDAFGKQVSKAGGIGIAAPVMREMLRMQGLR